MFVLCMVLNFSLLSSCSLHFTHYVLRFTFHVSHLTFSIPSLPPQTCSSIFSAEQFPSTVQAPIFVSQKRMSPPISLMWFFIIKFCFLPPQFVFSSLRGTNTDPIEHISLIKIHFPITDNQSLIPLSPGRLITCLPVYLFTCLPVSLSTCLPVSRLNYSLLSNLFSLW
jgi:hypothetical protein